MDLLDKEIHNLMKHNLMQYSNVSILSIDSIHIDESIKQLTIEYLNHKNKRNGKMKNKINQVFKVEDYVGQSVNLIEERTEDGTLEYVCLNGTNDNSYIKMTHENAVKMAQFILNKYGEK